jgi:hypothetical protein
MNLEMEYKKAFNHAYTLALYEPGLLTTICRNLNLRNNYLEGFFAGKEQFHYERESDLLSSIEVLRNICDNRDKDIER